jgi:WD repeat-containing protein mio
MPWGGALRLDQAMQVEADPTLRDGRDSFVRSLRFCRDQPGLLAVLSRTGQLKVFSTKTEYERPERRAEDGPQLREVQRSDELDPQYAETGRKNDRIVAIDWVTLQSPLLRPRMLVLRASGAFDILEKPSQISEYLYNLVPWQSPYRGLEEGSRYHAPMDFEATDGSAIYGPLVVEQALADLPVFGIARPKIDMIAQEAVAQADGTIASMVSAGGQQQKSADAHVSPKGSTIADMLKSLRLSEDRNGASPRTNGHKQHHSKAPLKDLSTHRHRHHSLLASTRPSALQSAEAQAVLDHIMLLRAKEKYLFDAKVNQRVVSDDPWLQCVWSWVQDAEDAAEDGGMMCSPLDLSYLGVSTIWKNDLGSNPAARLADDSAAPGERGWERCLEAIGKKRGVLDFEGAQTRRPQHRRLCLDMCRWGGPRDVDLSASDQSMDLERASSMRTRAAAQALFRGDVKEAVYVLQKASTTHPELLFVALAIQLMSDRPDHETVADQLEFDERVASRTDPYLRAISSLIATRDWRAIANQRSLPMRDRVYIAMKYFGDEELTAWLEEEVALAVETGDIEGIVLTGITDGLVDILAKYVQKFLDYQTATLLLSICAPRYIDDLRCAAMRNAYRAYLQRHRAFFQRCKFEVESTKRSKHNGVPTVKPPGRQIALRCVYCDAETSLEQHHKLAIPPRSSGAISPLPASAPSPAVKVTSSTTQSNPFTEKMVRAGISCPNCKRHLPRCVVCLEVVGMPRSDRPELSSDSDTRLAARFPTFCLKCEHVLHLDHARQWFARHQECPVPECRCKCNFRANPELSYP